MVKDFGPEAQQAVNGNTQAEFSNYKIRFIKPDIAVVDAILTVHNVNGPDGTVVPVINLLPGTASAGDGSGSPAFASLDSPRSSFFRSGRGSRGRSR